MQADKGNHDLDELLVDKGEIIAECLRDEGSERSFKQNLVVGEHADDGCDEQDSEQGQGCQPSQRVVSYVGAVFLEEGFQAGENSFRAWQEGSKARGLRACESPQDSKKDERE